MMEHPCPLYTLMHSLLTEALSLCMDKLLFSGNSFIEYKKGQVPFTYTTPR
jgi:hypothetical protein